jgi:ABC-2 type transport system permease protein
VAIGILFSVIIPKIKSVIAVSLPTVFAFFIIGTLGAILGNDNVRYITPFKFYDTSYVINNGGYETSFLLIEISFVVLATIASYVIYFKKDVRSAS